MNALMCYHGRGTFCSKNVSFVRRKRATYTRTQVFKKCRARACIQGNLQVPLHTYDPLRVSAAVVHPAGIYLVNIIIVNFGLLVFKIDDPKAFCQGTADYPIYIQECREVSST